MLVRNNVSRPTRDDLIRRQRSRRRCIRCDGFFNSTWPGDRVCTACRRNETRALSRQEAVR